MSQFIEVTEEQNNGATHETAITKSLVLSAIDDFVAEGSKTIIFVKGRGQKDTRLVSEDYATVLAAANAAPSADVERVVDFTVKAMQGDLESRVTPYNKGINKDQVIEFYADPQDANDSIVVTSLSKNEAERVVYTVDDTYANIKSSFDA